MNPLDLRSQAETRCSDWPPLAAAAAEPQELLHELQVHQIELEMQNDALRRSQEELEASRDRFADFYESAPVGYLTITDKGLISAANLTAAQLLRAERSDLLLRRFSQFVVPEQTDLWYSYCVNALKSDEKQSCELELLAQDGVRLHVRLDSLRLLKPGRPSTLRTVVTNIMQQVTTAAELKRYQYRLEELVEARTAELRQAQLAAETANQAKGAFLANISHEIRAPLNTIAGMLYLLHRSGLTQEQLGRVEKIEVAEKRLLKIMDALLAVADLESGQFVPVLEAVSVSRVVERAINVIRPTADAKSLRLFSEVAPVAQPLLGDPTKLQQALQNYLDNAVKFTESGSITVRTSVADEAHDDVLLRFEVTDTGIGIAPEDTHHLFCLFEQADHSATLRHTGVGLGLVMTRKLAQIMGGEASMVSTPLAGSTFWFTAWLKKGACPLPPG